MAIHELDARVLERFEERLLVASRDVGVFMRRAGVSEDARCGLPHAARSTRDDRHLALNGAAQIRQSHACSPFPALCPTLTAAGEQQQA